MNHKFLCDPEIPRNMKHLSPEICMWMSTAVLFTKWAESEVSAKQMENGMWTSSNERKWDWHSCQWKCTSAMMLNQMVTKEDKSQGSIFMSREGHSVETGSKLMYFLWMSKKWCCGIKNWEWENVLKLYYGDTRATVNLLKIIESHI